MDLSVDSKVRFYPMYIDTYNGLEEEYIVGRKDTGEYISVPKVAVESIEMLNKGMSIGEVESSLAEKYMEEIGVIDFVSTCQDLNFIKEVDGVKISSDDNQSPSLANQFDFIKPTIAKLFFNPIAWLFYIVLVIYSVILYIISPASLPRIKDFLFHDSLTVVVTFGLVSMWGLIFIHELGHLMAARAHETESRVKFGRSGMYLVIETVIPNIWSVSKKGRNEIFLAGLAFNAIMLAVSLTFVCLHDVGVMTIPEALYRFLRFVHIINVWSFITQPLIFTKSDLYYVLNNQWNCTDLHGNTAIYTKKNFKFTLSPDEALKLNSVSVNERNKMKKYMPIYMTGIVFSALVAIGYTSFTLWYFLRSKDVLFSGEILTLNFWDHFFGVGYLLTPIIWLFTYIVIDFYRDRKKLLPARG
jgi:putative peptide zinc metalloprotease protein